MEYKIFTDGSRIDDGRGNTLSGGAFIITKNSQVIMQDNFRFKEATIYKAEMFSIYSALSTIYAKNILNDKDNIVIYCDNQTLVDRINGVGYSSKHMQIWSLIDDICDEILRLGVTIHVKHIGAHNTSQQENYTYNRAVDKLARSASASPIKRRLVI